LPVPASSNPHRGPPLGPVGGAGPGGGFPASLPGLNTVSSGAWGISVYLFSGRAAVEATAERPERVGDAQG
jgi:hypothetical protein